MIGNGFSARELLVLDLDRMVNNFSGFLEGLVSGKFQNFVEWAVRTMNIQSRFAQLMSTTKIDVNKTQSMRAYLAGLNPGQGLDGKLWELWTSPDSFRVFEMLGGNALALYKAVFSTSNVIAMTGLTEDDFVDFEPERYWALTKDASH